MSVNTRPRRFVGRPRALLAAVGTLALTCAFLVLPATPAFAADSGNCSGTIQADTHGSKDKLHKDRHSNVKMRASLSADCTTTDPNVTSVTGTGTVDVSGTCLAATLTFTFSLQWSDGTSTTIEGSGALATEGNDIVVNIDVALTTGGRGHPGAGAGIVIRFTGAGLACLTDGAVSGGTGDLNGSGAGS